VTSIPVFIISQQRKMQAVVTDMNGTVELCDAPLEPVDLVASEGQGTGLVAQGVRPSWPRTQTIRLVYDRKLYNRDLLPTACVLLIRVRDSKGAGIDGVRLDRGVEADTLVSDALGRLYLRLEIGEKVTGALSKVGYSREAVTVSCDRTSPNIELERILSAK
jgi:hypothetical protein